MLDGLDFCGKVYDMFDSLHTTPEGITQLRARKSPEKQLIEELLPIARYILARYRVGRRLEVQWTYGSQPYDAILRSRGKFVERGVVPPSCYLEATVAMPENSHLVREHLQREGHSYAAKGISRDRKTRKVISEPYMFSNDEKLKDLVNQITNAISAKSAKSYPTGTVLIVSCESDGLLLEEEWNEVVDRVKALKISFPFSEVFLLENNLGNNFTLPGSTGAALIK